MVNKMKKIISLNSFENDSYSLKKYILELGGDNKSIIKYLKKAMMKAIDCELSSRQAFILKKHYFDNLSVTEISSLLHVNKSTISRSLKRSVNILKKSLKYAAYALSLIERE